MLTCQHEACHSCRLDRPIPKHPFRRIDGYRQYKSQSDRIRRVYCIFTGSKGLTIFPLFVMHQLRPRAVRLFDDLSGLFGENAGALISRQIELSIDDFKVLGVYTGNLAG